MLDQAVPVEIRAKIHDFIQSIVCGELTPLDRALETTNYMAYGDFESVVMRYAHGDCFALAALLVLMDEKNQLTPYFLRSSDGYYHGLVAFKGVDGSKVFLDSNGLQTESSITKQWKFVTRQQVEFVESDREDFLEAINPDDEELEDAAHEFSEWVSFVLDKNIFLNVICSKVAQKTRVDKGVYSYGK